MTIIPIEVSFIIVKTHDQARGPPQRPRLQMAPGIDEVDNELATMTIRPNNDVVSSGGPSSVSGKDMGKAWGKPMGTW